MRKVPRNALLPEVQVVPDVPHGLAAAAAAVLAAGRQVAHPLPRHHLPQHRGQTQVQPRGLVRVQPQLRGGQLAPLQAQEYYLQQEGLQGRVGLCLRAQKGQNQVELQRREEPSG